MLEVRVDGVYLKFIGKYKKLSKHQVYLLN